MESSVGPEEGLVPTDTGIATLLYWPYILGARLGRRSVEASTDLFSTGRCRVFREREYIFMKNNIPRYIGTARNMKTLVIFMKLTVTNEIALFRPETQLVSIIWS
jgi:hypothetical protein